MKYYLSALLMILFVVSLIYTDIAWKVFQFRNPKANQSTFYSHFVDVVSWKKLDSFQ